MVGDADDSHSRRGDAGGMTGMEKAMRAGTRTRTRPSTTGSRFPTHQGEPHVAGTAGR
jgi:hypothetical protein